MKLLVVVCSFCLMIISAVAFAQQESADAPIEVPPETPGAVVTKRVAPVYPPLARQARIQGTVILKVVIDKSGEVRDAQVLSGHPMLSPAAIEAVKQWRYRPYEKDGVLVDIQTTVRVSFKLAEHPPSGTAGDAPGGLPTTQVPIGMIHACQDSPDESMGKRVRVSSGVMQGLILDKQVPEYPEDARRQNIEGVVVLAIAISKGGSVCDIALISGHPLLAPAAIAAVRRWRYRPYLLNGEPAEIETQAQVTFSLRR